MSLRLVTFDLDDTLWEVAPVLRRAEAAQGRWLQTHRPAVMELLEPETLRALKREVWAQQHAQAHDVGALRRALLQELQQRAGYDARETAEGTIQAFAVFLEERQRIDLHPAALPMLRQLATRYRIGALSNGNANIFRTAAGDYFEFAFSAAEVGASKPAPALFEAALSSTGIAPQHSVHIGDHPEHDVEGARRAGLKTVWLNNRGQRWELIAGDLDPADAEISSLHELPAALDALQVSAS